MQDDEKVIKIPSAAIPTQREIHKDVKPVKMKSNILTSSLDYKRSPLTRLMSPDGAAMVRHIGEVDYRGNPARQALNALHVIAELRHLVKKDSETNIEVQTALGIEGERMRHFSYVAGIEV